MKYRNLLLYFILDIVIVIFCILYLDRVKVELLNLFVLIHFSIFIFLRNLFDEIFIEYAIFKKRYFQINYKNYSLKLFYFKEFLFVNLNSLIWLFYFYYFNSDIYLQYIIIIFSVPLILLFKMKRVYNSSSPFACL
jgi:hypothetical protein